MTSGLNTGSTRLATTLDLTAVNTDHGTTSLRLGNSGNGLLGLWVPAPCPVAWAGAAPKGDDNWACATPSVANASPRPASNLRLALRVTASVRMPHAAVLAYAQALAGGLKLGHADLFALFGFQAFGRAFMCCSHGAVAGDVFSHFFVTVGLGPR